MPYNYCGSVATDILPPQIAGGGSLIQIWGEMNTLKKESEGAKKIWLHGLRIGHVGTISHCEKTAYYIKNSPTRLHGFINQKISVCNFNTRILP
jgi:hypothetical protein